MKVTVESCNSSRHGSLFRLTLPNGAREFVTGAEGEDWNRSLARKALDLIENVYHINRRSVRFSVQ